MRRPSHLPMAKLAYQDPRFMESLGARPLRILAEYLDPLARLRREKVADTIVMFGSARIHSREQNSARAKRSSSALARPAQRPVGGTDSSRQIAPRDVALLRRSARTIAAYHELVLDPRRAPQALRHLLGRRPGNHGRSEPRRFRRRRLVHWTQHPASPRAAPQSLHHRRPEFLLPLFLHAQAVVRADGESADRVSRRIRHDGRAI